MNNKNNKSQAAVGSFFKAHPIILHLLLIALTVVVLGWLSMMFLDIWTVHGKTTTVPEIKNTSYNEAAQLLDNMGLRIEISDSIYDPSIPPGTVIESWPKVGAVVKPGREVYVTITSFTPRQVVVEMPLRDVSSRQAVSYLESLGISNIRLVSVPSQFDDLVEGALYDGREIYVGMKLPVNAVVTLRVGSVPTEQPVDSLEEGEGTDLSGDDVVVDEDETTTQSSYYD